MGFLDFLGPKDSKAAMRKQAQRVTEKYGPPENRQKTIAQLAEQGTPEALAVLCLRFTIRSDPGITDDEEKEEVRRILGEAGDLAVGPVKVFLAAQESGVSWGLRVLSELRPPHEVVATALALLRKLGREYTRDPEKKLVLLGWLSEHHGDLTGLSSYPASGPPAPGEGAAGATEGESLDDVLLPLLEDFSDDVRIATTRLLALQPPHEGARVALIELLLRDVDNARVRGEVLQALFTLGADVKGYRPRVEALLADPWHLDREGKLGRRG